MDNHETRGEKIQWNWVAVSCLLYFVLYLAPLLVMGSVLSGDVVGDVAGLFIGGWTFGGILVVSALAGYLSKGITIWEPAIAGVILVVFFFTLFYLIMPPSGIPILPIIVSMFVTSILVFLLSIVGAWWGEKAQKLWRGKSVD